MNETMVTLVGNAATQVEWRDSATGGAARFRLAVTARRFDREKQAWVDGATSFYTVWAARTLGKNLTGSVAIGEPLLVHGRLKVRAEERQDGTRWFSADVDAVAIGHDMTRGTTAFRRVFKGEAVAVGRDERAGFQGEVGGSAPADSAGGGPGPGAAGPVDGGAGPVSGGAPVVWESVSATVSDAAPMGV
ncbi:single-stranded DNA-binding protein [Streptomyces sp. NBC_00083]|uniref:single-stranded DNA-binding protein n=1 Tax=Streptomyces sp. NBC_00083 TaxID=2975647 RepID=UPI0022563609|nr:single-stranded DNA-binding protein [Streptomyces sp. NBC_00083]MCX5382373.1 single-stranded DNA-binding protein [Streptomyces sp. NBC_00083]